jgi:hypothetical protein
MTSLPLTELEALPVGDRYSILGNALYPRVLGLVGTDALAGKVTGMLLELPLPQLHEMTTPGDKAEVMLADMVQQARTVLPAEGAASPDTITAALDMTPPTVELHAPNSCAGTPIAAIPLAEAFNSLNVDGTTPDKASVPVVEDKDAALAAALGWEYTIAEWAAYPAADTVAFIVDRLQERNSVIVSAVADEIDLETALRLLARTEDIQQKGGILVPETGKPRSSGGIYLKLLKEATDLPEASRNGIEPPSKQTQVRTCRQTLAPQTHPASHRPIA